MKSMLVKSCAFMLVVGLLGCGGGTPMSEVEGVVRLNGKPLDKIQVEFWPTSSGPRSFGTSDQDGKFKLTTDDGKHDGASIGNHKVVLHDIGIMGDKFLGREGETVDMTQGRKSRVAAKYATPETTPISQEVVSGKKNEVKIEVSAK